MLSRDVDLCGLALGSAGGLVDHDLSIGESEPLSFGAAGKQECAHAGCHSDTGGAYVAFDIIHRIVDRHTGCNGAAGAVDVQIDILIGVFRLQEQKLCHHKAGGHVIDLFSQEDDPVF